MASTKTRTKTVRISNDCADFFEGKALNRAIESVHTLIQEKKLEFDGESLKIVGLGGVHTEKYDEILRDIGQMARCMHVETEEFLQQVCDGLNEGYLTCEGGKVKGIPEIDLTGFYDVCHELGLRPQEALNKMVQNMRRGK